MEKPEGVASCSAGLDATNKGAFYNDCRKVMFGLFVHVFVILTLLNSCPLQYWHAGSDGVSYDTSLHLQTDQFFLQQRPWFKVSKSAGTPNYSSLYKYAGPDSYGVGITFSVPYYDTSGRFRLTCNRQPDMMKCRW